MSAVSDAKRFLWLDSSNTEETALGHLKAVVAELERRGVSTKCEPMRTQLEARIVDLESRLAQSHERARTAEIELAKAKDAMKNDHLYRRVQQLETELKRVLRSSQISSQPGYRDNKSKT